MKQDESSQRPDHADELSEYTAPGQLPVPGGTLQVHVPGRDGDQSKAGNSRLAGVKIVSINPLSYKWSEEMIAVAKALSE